MKMDNFVFYNPVRVLFGEMTIAHVGREIKDSGIKRVLLLAGGGSIRENGVYENVTKSLRRAGIEWEELWGVRPNPALSHTRTAVALCREKKLEAVLAIGGGSVIDEGKSIAAGFYLNDPWGAYDGTEKIARALPLFTILTISATGSEMNPTAVLTNDDEKKKWATRSEHIYPRVSIIDPSVQMSLPWNQTVNGGIDSIVHVLEQYFMGTNQEITISLDEAIVSTIIKSIDRLKADPKDYNARANFAWSSTLALNGISGIAMKGGDWATHNIEHSISAFHPRIAHGEGLAVVYPAWIRYMQKENMPQFLRWAKTLWNAASVDEAVDAMKNKFSEWGAPVSLRELSIGEDEIPAIASNAMIRGNFGNLKKLDYEDVVNILNGAC